MLYWIILIVAFVLTIVGISLMLPKKCPKAQQCGPNCCPLGKKCTNREKGTCVTPCGNGYCDPTQECLTDDSTGKGYCSKKGCGWSSNKFDPPSLNDAQICKNPTSGEQVFCDYNGQAVNDSRTVSSSASSKDKCDIESCRNRLSHLGPNGLPSPNISYDPKTGECKSTDECSQILPKCTDVKKFPFTDHAEHMCKDDNGVFTGQMCPEGPCVHGGCRK